MLPTRWLIAAFALFSFAPPALAAETETRGVLVQIRGRSVLVLRDASGQERQFKLTDSTPSYRGTSHQIRFEYSQITPGTRIRITHDGDDVTAIYEEYRWYAYAGLWVDEGIDAVYAWSQATLGPRALLSDRQSIVSLVSSVIVALVCGLVSSMVVTNRMAFFSDALAHCAFAGVALGFIFQLVGAGFGDSGILGTMLVFGVLVGIAIAAVREHTALANDTVIGVFFAGAMGLGAVLLTGIGNTGSRFSPENFVFGDPQAANGQDIVYLVLLLVAIVLLFGFFFNRLVFASFNPSLARSRNFPVRLGNYLFIALLGLIVNLCLKTVGALLISALLVVPAASAANVARNLRQFFWWSIVLSLLPALLGWLICHKWSVVYEGREIWFGSGGVTVVGGVIIFFVSMTLSRWFRGARTAARTSF
jgi:zinc transport system permease protein